MRTAIIGSRTINNIKIDLDFTPELIISGGAKGIDTLAKNYANENNIKLLEIKPDYKAHHFKVAPIMRNIDIVRNCDVLIAFWDGKSKGTEFTIKEAKKQNKKIIIKMVI